MTSVKLDEEPQVDIQFLDLKRITDETIDALKQVRDSGGKLANPSASNEQ